MKEVKNVVNIARKKSSLFSGKDYSEFFFFHQIAGDVDSIFLRKGSNVTSVCCRKAWWRNSPL